VVFGALVFKLSVRCGAEGYVPGLRAKNHPFHLVGILFPHINDDAGPKSHQSFSACTLPLQQEAWSR
jgi:hypothetical protein